MSNLTELKWQDASGVEGVYCKKTNSYIKDALWFCSTLVADYVIKCDEDTGRYIVNYGGRTENEYDTVEEAKHWCEHTHYAGKMQPYVAPYSISSYFDKFTQWGLDRGIIQNGDILAQGLKLVSEIGELSDNLAKDRCIKDDIGDCMVVLTMLANMTDTPIEDCLAQAWGDIKDRKGYMNEHGVFIKDSDVE
ncbi:MAG: MazG-like family protein [Psychrobacter sp.]